MSLFFKWGGIALVMIGAMLVSREYESYLDKRICEYRGLVAMISHAESEIGKSLAYGEGLWSSFQSDELEKIGLLPLLRKGCSLKDAFDECKGKMTITRESKEEISELFATLGRGYRDSELRLLGEIKDSLSAELDLQSDAAEKNKKIARALLLGGALTVAIMGM